MSAVAVVLSKLIPSLLLGFVLLASCASNPSARRTATSPASSALPAASAPAASGALQPSAPPLPATGWSCAGNPPEIAPGWKSELAVVPATAPNALEKAMQGAQDKLRAKVCVNADRDRAVADACSYLASHIEPWVTGTNGRDTCASAVIKRQYIDEWTTVGSDLEGFDKKLASAAKDLLHAARGRGKRTSGPPRVALVAVYDDNEADARQNQLPGGRRADWLASRFKAAFAAALIWPWALSTPAMRSHASD